MNEKSFGGRAAWFMCAALCAFGPAAVGCGGKEPVAPHPDEVSEAAPPPGSRGSGVTNTAGTAILTLGGIRTTINVVDQNSKPAPGVRVGVTVGREVAALVAVDPTGALEPILVVQPVERFQGSRTVRVDGPSFDSAAGDPITITMLILGGALSLKELISDPLHHKLVIDDGVLKSCVVGDLNDLRAFLQPLVSLATGYVFVSVLGQSRAFALVADAGLTAFGELFARLEFMDRDRVIEPTCVVLVGDDNFGVQLAVISGVVGGGIMAQDDLSPSTIFFVEPNPQGTDYALKQVRTSTGLGVHITDMAYWDEVRGEAGSQTLTNPVLYAVSFNTLYRLNRSTGVAENLGALGNRGINALAFDRFGKLFAGGATGELLVLDRQTGTILSTVVLSPFVAFSGDLLVLPDGSLVGTVTGSSGSDRLAEINPVTGAVRIIGDVGFDGVYGLSLFDNRLWGLTVQSELLEINATTGQGTFVRSLTFRTNGAGDPITILNHR